MAVVGRPNVGKSTFINSLAGRKVSIVSHRRQTTRGVIRAICRRKHAQLIMLDSPGFQTRRSGGINRHLNSGAQWAAGAADVVIFMLTPKWTDEDADFLSRLPAKTIIAAINKIDLVKNKKELLPFVDDLRQRHNFAAIVPLCARNGRGIVALSDEIAALLPESPALFTNEERIEDRDFLLGELLREKIFRALGDELPYSIGVSAQSERGTGKTLRVLADIYVERESQRAIVIGSDGEMLRKLTTIARREMERVVGSRIYLTTQIKVRPAWQKDKRLLTQMKIGPPN